MHIDAEAQKIDNTVPVSKPKKKRTLPYLIDGLIVLAMITLLYCGASWQLFHLRTDAAKYQCYAVAFWQGTPALRNLPGEQCEFITHPSTPLISSQAVIHKMQAYGFPAFLISFVKSQSPMQPLCALPHEYPLLTIVPFSLGLIVPSQWYQVAFAIWMGLFAGLIYFVLKRFNSRGVAIAFALYLVVGSWATAEGRFDLIPAGFTLVALICAERSRWKWAFAMLALATLFKFYPLVLLIPFFIAQQKQASGKWYAWRRWNAFGVFVAVCVVVETVSLLLSVEGTLGPLSYFGSRPIQVESFSASLLWLGSFLGYPLQYAFTFGSLNVLGPLSSKVEKLGTIGLVMGLGYLFWLQWRGKMNLPTAVLLTLLIVMLTGKVFSPQYLIWVAPLVAYVGKSNWKWLLSWGVVALLTTCIYPYIYVATPDLLQVPYVPAFYPVAFVRNILLLGVILVLLYQATRRPQRSVGTSGMAEAV